MYTYECWSPPRSSFLYHTLGTHTYLKRKKSHAPFLMGPWTAAEAGSDAVSKKMLVEYLQTTGDAAFLEEHKLSGQVCMRHPPCP